MATSTVSQAIVSGAPPLAGSTVTLTSSPEPSTPVTFMPSLNVMPCLVRIFWNSLETSPSMPGVTRSRNSTTVTLAPRRRQTVPISRPM